MDDRELLARLAGDEREAERAFDEIFRTWYARLVGIAANVVREQAVAEELVQDVMLELWRRRTQLGRDGSAHAYLFRSVRNRALNHMRHQRVVERGAPMVDGPSEAGPGGSARVVEAEIMTALHAAVADLPPRCREVFELSRVHGLSYADIARALDVSVKTVEAQMGKALRILRERLAPWLPGRGPD